MTKSTMTALAAITATPAVALANAPIPIYRGPGLSFATGSTIPTQTYLRLIGAGEDRQWYLVQAFTSPPIQVWVQSSAVPGLVSGDFSLVPPIPTAQALGYVTFVPVPTITASPERCRLGRGLQPEHSRRPSPLRHRRQRYPRGQQHPAKHRF